MMKEYRTQIRSLFRRAYIAWNLFWWNHHVGLARMHDFRLKKMDAHWRELL